MIRTTDTGGIKLLYNGEVENGQCLNTRSNHVGYKGESNFDLSGTFYYGTDYNYNFSSGLFSLVGNIESKSWNENNSVDLIGKYTCKSTSSTGTCSTLYLVESFVDTDNAIVISLNNTSNYSVYGKLQYNRNFSSPGGLGYMYNALNKGVISDHEE